MKRCCSVLMFKLDVVKYNTNKYTVSYSLVILDSSDVSGLMLSRISLLITFAVQGMRSWLPQRSTIIQTNFPSIFCYFHRPAFVPICYRVIYPYVIGLLFLYYLVSRIKYIFIITEAKDVEKIRRQRWSENENKIFFDEMHTYISSKPLPPGSALIALSKKLGQRTIAQIRTRVHNVISGKLKKY